MTDDLVWIYRGGPEHARHLQTSTAVMTWVPLIDHGMSLIARILEGRRDNLTEVPTGNELAAVACFTHSVG